MAVSFADGITVKRSERGLGLYPRDIVVDRDSRGRHFGVSAENVERMRESIQEEGQKQNIVIRKLADGRPSVKAGYTRLEACLLIAATDPEFRIWCTLESGNEEDSFRTTLIENLERNDLSDVDHTYNHETLRRKYGKSDAEIARFYRWDAGKVSRLKRLLLLPESIQRKIHTGELSTGAGLAYAELPPDEQQEAVQAGVVKVTELHERIRKVKQKPAPPPIVQVEESSEPDLVITPSVTQDTRNRQRSLIQVKELLGRFTTNDTHLVVRMLASALLDYIHGGIDESGVKGIVQELCGKK